MSNIKNTRVWAKVIISPALVMIMGLYFSSEFYMPSMYMYLALGLIYALAAHILEMKYLKKRSVWFLTGLDSALALGLIIVVGLTLGPKGVHISFLGGLVYAVLQGGVEHILHLSAKPAKKKWKRTPKRRK